eukprot:786866_1
MASVHCTLVTIDKTILFYEQYISFKRNLIPSIGYKKESLSLGIPLLLQECINNHSSNLTTTDRYKHHSINLLFDEYNHIDDEECTLHYWTKQNHLTVSIVCNTHLNHGISTIQHILNKVHQKIESYFCDDVTSMPLYMIQIGCKSTFHRVFTPTLRYYCCCGPTNLHTKDKYICSDQEMVEMDVIETLPLQEHHIPVVNNECVDLLMHIETDSCDTDRNDLLYPNTFADDEEHALDLLNDVQHIRNRIDEMEWFAVELNAQFKQFAEDLMITIKFKTITHMIGSLECNTIFGDIITALRHTDNNIGARCSYNRGSTILQIRRNEFNSVIIQFQSQFTALCHMVQYFTTQLHKRISRYTTIIGDQMDNNGSDTEQQELINMEALCTQVQSLLQTLQTHHIEINYLCLAVFNTDALDQIQNNVRMTRDYVRSSSKYLAKAEHHAGSDTNLMDNIFADLENLFYILSYLAFVCQLHTITSCISLLQYIFKVLIGLCVVYPLIVLVSLVVILPSSFFILMVRVHKIENDISELRFRFTIIMRMICCQRFRKIINQFIRAMFVFSFVVIYPWIIVYKIIPNHPPKLWIASYLCVILLFQCFGTYRGYKSFEKRKATQYNERDIRFINPKQFVFNIGSVISILMMIYQIYQLTFFASQAIRTNNNDGQMDENNEVMMGMIQWMEICYLNINILDLHVLDYYMFFSLFFVGLLLTIFVCTFVLELKTFGVMHYGEEDEEQATEFYFHSFIGSIVYGHGELRHMNKWIAKIISFISDSIFLIICQKLILILSCDRHSIWIIDGQTVCWTGKHQIYACVSLILIGYYVPFCAMIAPILSVESEIDKKEDATHGIENRKEWIKQFMSLSNTIEVIAPYLSIVTVSEYLMLISTSFLFVEDGQQYLIIICQSLSMLFLLCITVKLCIRNLFAYGLTQNEPYFPYAVSMIRVFGFMCGLIGCGTQILIHYEMVNISNSFIIMMAMALSSSILLFVIFVKHHKFFAEYNYGPFDNHILMVRLEDEKFVCA